VYIGNFPGYLRDLRCIQAKAARACQHLSRKLQNNTLIHAFPSIA